MNDQQIIDELNRIERSLREIATTGQAACLDAMAEIEKIMDGIGIPPLKRQEPV